MATGRIVMGLLFFPRGGSAQVTRYLAAALGDAGSSVSLVAGSLGAPGKGSHAPTFFAGIDLRYLDYTAAVAGFETGASAVAAPVPMHPSYEDRQGAPDPVLAAVDPALAGHLSSVGEAPFAATGADRADLFHLHHLTSQHDAVARRWPHVPLVAHLHGTEIKLIEAIKLRAAVAGALDLTLAAMPDAVDHGAIDTGALDRGQLDLLCSTRWSQWRHGEFWLGRGAGGPRPPTTWSSCRRPTEPRPSRCWASRRSGSPACPTVSIPTAFGSCAWAPGRGGTASGGGWWRIPRVGTSRACPAQ
jgi:hypothetical protein